jgi:hypothetical protein
MTNAPVHGRASGLRRALGAIASLRPRRAARRRAVWPAGDPVVPALRDWPVAPPDRSR